MPNEDIIYSANLERNFRQELRRIQDQFNQDAEEAKRNDDAQAFLRAVRSRDQQIKAATENRGRY